MVTTITSGAGAQSYSYEYKPTEVKTESLELKDVKVDTSSLSKDVKHLNRLASSVEDKVTDETKESDDTKVSILVNKCTNLLTRASNKSLSEGQRTYIESEIDYLKQNINFLNMAL